MTTPGLIVEKPCGSCGGSGYIAGHDNSADDCPLCNRKPAEVFHPSVFIQEELDVRGWSLDRLAIEMGDDAGINRLALDFYMEVGRADRNLRIGEFSAQQLGKAFGVAPELFLNLENAWLEAQGQ